VGGVWFVRAVGGTNGWCMIYIEKGVENEFVVVCERANGQCELQGSLRHHELTNMRCFMPMRKKVY
jgi:hypothetical protein